MTYSVKTIRIAVWIACATAHAQSVEWSQVGGSLQNNQDLIGIVGQGYSTPPAIADDLDIQSGFLADPLLVSIRSRTVFSLGRDTLKTYGDPPFDLSSRLAAGAWISSDNPSVARVAGSTIVVLQAGSAILSVAEPDADTVSANFHVAPKSISVISSDAFKPAGLPDPALPYRVEGLVAPDTLSGAPGREPGETAGTYAILAGTLSAGPNYLLSFTGANFRIEAPASIATRPRRLPKNRELAADAVHPLVGKATTRESGRIWIANSDRVPDDHQSIELHANAPGTIEISIFDRIGVPVLHWSGTFGMQELSRSPVGEDGNRRLEIVWNLRSSNGTPVPAGVYLWKIEAATSDGQKLETVRTLGVK